MFTLQEEIINSIKTKLFFQSNPSSRPFFPDTLIADIRTAKIDYTRNICQLISRTRVNAYNLAISVTPGIRFSQLNDRQDNNTIKRLLWLPAFVLNGWRSRKLGMFVLGLGTMGVIGWRIFGAVVFAFRAF